MRPRDGRFSNIIGNCAGPGVKMDPRGRAPADMPPLADDDHPTCPHGSTWLDCLDCGYEGRLALAAARSVDKDQMMLDADEGSR